MKHFLFENYDGEQFLVGADNFSDAQDIADANFGVTIYSGQTLSEFEAECSGLDEY